MRSWMMVTLGVIACVVSVVVLVDRLEAAPGIVGPVALDPEPPERGATPELTPATPVTPATPPITYPVVGRGHLSIVPGTGAVIGRAGELLRFQVAIETDIANLDTSAFVALIEQTYGDPQGWTQGGRWRFQRVGPGQRADFVVYLVTPATRDTLCQDGYDRYTSCRHGDRVVLNVARFVHGVPDYGSPLDVYRQYMINHETGHRLGFGHELCPGPGQPAPVMQQQTLGLHGCLANAWPSPGGEPYHGASGNYPAA